MFNSTILITGGTGSLVKQQLVLWKEPKKNYCISRDEKQYDLKLL